MRYINEEILDFELVVLVRAFNLIFTMFHHMNYSSLVLSDNNVIFVIQLCLQF